MKNFRNKCLFFKYSDFSVIIVSIIILILLNIILFIMFFVKFDFSYGYNGLVIKDGDNFYVSIMVSDSELKKLPNYSFVVNKSSIDYEIINISNEYVLTDSGLKRELILSFDIDSDKKIVNNVLDLYFVSKKTFFDKIKEMLI